MSEKTSKMVPKYHYDQMEKSTKLRLRDEFLRRSGMSLITFYDKLRKDSFKPLERELYENIFIIQHISVPLKSGQININQTIPEKGKN